MRYLILIQIIYSLNADGQSLKDFSFLNTITLADSNQVQKFQISEEDHYPKAKDELLYTWYSSSALFHTRGGYDGKLLHGDYTIYYTDDRLKCKGQYVFGLKNGKWTNWFRNGEIESVYNYHKGQLDGKYKNYDMLGNQKDSGEYKNGNKIAPKLKVDAETAEEGKAN